MDLAHDTLYSIQTVLRHSLGTRALKSLGAFTGWGGVIYLFSHLGVLWQEPALFQEAERLVELLPSLTAQDQEFDVVAGSAGGVARRACSSSMP